MGAPLDNMFLHWYMWPFIIAALIHLAYKYFTRPRDTHAPGMDAAGITHRDEFMEENPWHEN